MENSQYYSDIRLGIVLAINWNDITQDSIIINKSIAKDKINGEYSITSPKTLKLIRTIKLDVKTLNNLQHLKKYYNEFIGFNDNWFVFGGLFSLPRTTITRRKNYYYDLANIKRIRIHDFRHSHGTYYYLKELLLL